MLKDCTIFGSSKLDKYRVLLLSQKSKEVKFIYSEKATKFCEISTVYLSYVVPVKSTVEISQNFVAFSECMNFKIPQIWPFLKGVSIWPFLKTFLQVDLFELSTFKNALLK